MISMKIDLQDENRYCYRCGNSWYSALPKPKRCPRCGSSSWNIPRSVNAVCSKCGNRWERKSYSEKCPKCGNNSFGNEQGLHCNQCDYDWIPKNKDGPKKCPSCHSDKWNLPKQHEFTCQICGHIWVNRSDNPKKCPNCQSKIWNRPKIRLWCVRCGHRWSPREGRNSSEIKLCPYCKSTNWNKLPETIACPKCGHLFIKNKLGRCPNCSGFSRKETNTCGFCGASWLGGRNDQTVCPRCGMNRETVRTKCFEAWSDKTYCIRCAEDNGSKAVYLWKDDKPIASVYIHDLLKNNGITINKLSYRINNPDYFRFWKKIRDDMIQHSSDYEKFVPYFMKRLNLSEEESLVLSIHFTGMCPEAIALKLDISLTTIRSIFDKIMNAYSNNGIVVDDTVFTDDPFKFY